MKLWVAIFCMIALPLLGKGQYYPDSWSSDSLNHVRLRNTVIVGGGLYVVGMAGLYTTWYSQYNSGKFHVFNDASEWEGVDKLGHAFTAYTIARMGYEGLNYSGMTNQQSAWYASGYAMLFQTTIEVFDGFSEGWGFSWADMASNTVGTGMFLAQQLAWKEQRFSMKFSYSPSSYAQYRPALLGRSWNEKILKDYNGQTYWLSGNIHAFLPDESQFPPWINIAVGYGADGMLGGHENPQIIGSEPAPYFERTRQLYLSADIDFTRIKTRSKALKSLFIALSWVKLPFPTLEVNSQGQVLFHPIYF